MKFQLVIPMSGIGLRFINKGYRLPKPLINVNGQPIINHVFNIFKNIDSVIFICNEEHLLDKELNLKGILKKLHPESSIVSIKPHKKGPVYAVMQATQFINDSLPTIVNYCDFFCLFNEELFIQLIEEEKPDGCIFTYTGFHPHMISNTNYAYVKKYNNLVDDVQEKQPFTNKPMTEEASSGSYYFKSGSLMKKYFEKTLDSDLKVNGEYYVSMVYKIMIDDKRKVNTFKINYFMQWGTPSDLEEYLWYSNLFTSLINHQKNIKPFHKGSLLMPMAGEGRRFQEKGFNIPKPLIEVSGKAMFKQALNDLPYTDFSHLVIRKDKFIIMKKTDKLQLNDKAYVVVNSSQMQETLTVFGHNEKISNKMLIIGGGNIGFNLAKNIEQSFDSTRVKIIEKDKDRAEYIANELNDTIVINGNGLDEDVLNEANIDEVETVLALTNDDEDNLMVSVIVEKFSKDKRTMALINKPNYSLLQSSLKIDDLIDPRMSTVSSILKHVHKGTIENAYTISNGEYEVIEAEIIEAELL